MEEKSEFRSVEFFRKIRDEQAAVLADKSPAEIIACFCQATSRPTPRSSGRTKSSARRLALKLKTIEPLE